MNMPARQLIFSLLSLCMLVAAVAAAPAVAGLSSAAADTSGVPPQDAPAYIAEARAAVAGSNWTSVLVITTRGLAWYPDNTELLGLQGYSLRKMGQFQRSVDTVSRAIALDPTAVRYAIRGYGYLALGNNAAALADAETGISLDANYTANYAVKALALSGMGRHAEALAAADAALAQVPDSAHYWQVKGRVFAAEGDCAGAAAALEKSTLLDAEYVLPYPGFGTAGENLAAVRAGCGKPRTAATTAKSPLGWIAAVGLAGAIITYRIRR